MEKSFLIFEGLGNSNSLDMFFYEGLPQFREYKIGIKDRLFFKLLVDLMNAHPAYFSEDKVKNIIGFETLKFI